MMKPPLKMMAHVSMKIASVAQMFLHEIMTSKQKRTMAPVNTSLVLDARIQLLVILTQMRFTMTDHAIIAAA